MNHDAYKSLPKYNSNEILMVINHLLNYNLIGNSKRLHQFRLTNVRSLLHQNDKTNDNNYHGVHLRVYFVRSI